MFLLLSNKNRVFEKPNNCAKTAFLLATAQLTVLPFPGCAGSARGGGAFILRVLET
jgi:hypothetical protein